MKRFSVLTLLLLAAACSAAAQFKDSVSAKSPTPERNAVIAVALSMLMPGAGQLYNGDRGKAALHFGLFAGSVTWVALRDIGPTNADIKPLDWLSVISVGATYLWAVIDAGVSAQKVSDAPSGSLRELDSRASPPHLSVSTYGSRGISGISLTYRF